jgi:hypothetical protein
MNDAAVCLPPKGQPRSGRDGRGTIGRISCTPRGALCDGRLRADTPRTCRARRGQARHLASPPALSRPRLLGWTSSASPGPSGAPGTGKTTALRALVRVWSDWCATHFITDPEEFLGSGTGYLLEVLTAEPAQRRAGDVEWKMVVLEDAGELLSVDAHSRTGQALSRLLNVTDGLLGQGTNVVVLVTTNEPLRGLHPAVTRPGRCWRSIEFQPLTVREANGWLAAHNSAERVSRARALADLYEVLRGRTPEVERPFGFGSWTS